MRSLTINSCHLLLLNAIAFTMKSFHRSGRQDVANSFFNIIFTSLIFLFSLLIQLPYAFYVNNVEVISSINETLIELAEAGTLPSLCFYLSLKASRSSGHFHRSEKAISIRIFECSLSWLRVFSILQDFYMLWKISVLIRGLCK
jgi:hypothetical protein